MVDGEANADFLVTPQQIRVVLARRMFPHKAKDITAVNASDYLQRRQKKLEDQAKVQAPDAVFRHAINTLKTEDKADAITDCNNLYYLSKDQPNNADLKTRCLKYHEKIAGWVWERVDAEYKLKNMTMVVTDDKTGDKSAKHYMEMAKEKLEQKDYNAALGFFRRIVHQAALDGRLVPKPVGTQGYDRDKPQFLDQQNFAFNQVDPSALIEQI